MNKSKDKKKFSFDSPLTCPIYFTEFISLFFFTKEIISPFNGPSPANINLNLLGYFILIIFIASNKYLIPFFSTNRLKKPITISST